MKVKMQITDNRGNVYEGICDLHPAQKLSGKPVGQSKSVKTRNKPKPSSAIETLYRSEFFKNAQGLGDVAKMVSDKLGYNFDPASLLMAMKASAYLLRRGSKGSYRFIQRCPPE